MKAISIADKLPVDIFLYPDDAGSVVDNEFSFDLKSSSKTDGLPVLCISYEDQIALAGDSTSLLVLPSLTHMLRDMIIKFSSPTDRDKGG